MFWMKHSLKRSNPTISDAESHGELISGIYLMIFQRTHRFLEHFCQKTMTEFQENTCIYLIAYRESIGIIGKHIFERIFMMMVRTLCKRAIGTDHLDARAFADVSEVWNAIFQPLTGVLMTQYEKTSDSCYFP